MAIRTAYVSDVSGDDIPESQLVEVIVRRNNEETISHLSESELDEVIDDEPTLNRLVLHD